MNVQVRNVKNETVGEVNIPDELLAADSISMPLMHQAVKAHLANRRQGTAATKTRAMVSGSGRKLWKQKHTGRARVGSIRSPLWRHGGTVHGPQPRDYRMGLPKKMRKAALRSAVATKHQDGKLLIIDDLSMQEAKTKSAAIVFKTLGVKSAVVLDTPDNLQLRRAMRNLQKFQFSGDASVPVYELLKHDSLVVSLKALSTLLEALR